jgi:hypothetical protein
LIGPWLLKGVLLLQQQLLHSKIAPLLNVQPCRERRSIFETRCGAGNANRT